MSETAHKLTFKDEKTGKLVETTALEWKVTELHGTKWFYKKIEGRFFHFDMWTAQRMGIHGSYPAPVPLEKVDPKRLFGVGGSAPAKPKKGGRQTDGVKVEWKYAKRPDNGVTRSATTGTSGSRVTVITKATAIPKRKKGLNDLSVGTMLKEEVKRLSRGSSVSELRARHIAKHNG